MIRKNSTICANYQLIMRMTGGFLEIPDERPDEKPDEKPG
jgi:hypothetical protein